MPKKRQPNSRFDADGVEVIKAPVGDARLERAAERARKRFGEVRAAMTRAASDHAIHRAVKLAVPLVPGPGYKHMWFTLLAIEGDTLQVQLANDPEGKVALQPDQRTTAQAQDVEDWTIDRGGKKYVGGFSIPILDEIARQRKKTSK